MPAYKALRHLNAKILRLHAKRLQSSMSNTVPTDNIPRETLYKLIRKRKWRFSRLVRSVRDDTGTIQTSVTGMASVFTSFFQHKYRRIDPNNECVAAFANLIRTELPQDMVHTYESPFASEEIYQSINSAGDE